jgi:small conductance mechanosensitive channel
MILTEAVTWESTTSRWLNSLGDFALQKLLPAALILVAGLCVLRALTLLVDRLLERSRLEKAAHSLIRTVVRVVIWLVLGLTAAACLGIDVTGIVALASVLTLVVSLSVQNALTNLVSGFTIICTKPFSSGDWVEIAGQSGAVKEIGLTYTKLCTADNKTVYIPNGAVTSAQIVNYTVLGKRRLEIKVTASYDAPVEAVLEALKEAGSVESILPEEGVFVALNSYGDSAMEYVLRVWCACDQYWPTNYAITERIKRCFDARGIEMTYPHLNVHLDK